MYYFVVNPQARSGKGKVTWEKIEKVLQRREIPYEVLFTEMVPMFITTLSQTRMKSRFLAADKYISPKKSNSVGASWLKPSRKIAHLRLSSPPYIMEAQRRQAR